jgi:SAM-dependent methyltransferase
MKFRDSTLAHIYLDNLVGVEIGASAHNPFNLPHCINVDYTDSMNTVFKWNEYKLCNEKAKVDIVADGGHLPFKDNEYDYVISSHVIEHFFDPIAVLEEWMRVVRPGGYVFIIAPSKIGVKKETRGCTNYEELIKRHSGVLKPEDVDMTGYQTSIVSGLPLNEHGHWSVWNLKEFIELCDYMGLNVVTKLERDDKVGNGFCVVIKK